MLTLLTFLALLSLTPLLPLLPLAHPLIERVDAARELACPVERLAHGVGLARLPERRGRLSERVLQRLEVRADRAFHRLLFVLRAAGANHRARVADLVAHLGVADRLGALGQLARGLFLLRPQIARRSIELLLELADFLFERAFPLHELLRLFLTALTRGVEPLDVVGDLLLLARELLGLLQRVLHVALGAARLRLLQPPLRLLEPLQRRGRLGAAALLAVGGRLAHRIGRLAQLPRRLHQLRPVLLARQLFEPARRFFRLVRELALLLTGAAARGLLPERGAPPLPLRFLLLPARELLQLLHQLVELLIRLLLRGLLTALVLVRHLVELHLEQVGEILRHGAATAASAAAPLLALHLDLHLVFFFRLLQELQRLLLGRQRRFGVDRLQLGFGGLHLRDGLRQQLRHLLEGRILLDETAVHPA